MLLRNSLLYAQYFTTYQGVLHRPEDMARAKYHLVHSVRTHMGQCDEAFSCMGNNEDGDRHCGINLQNTVLKVAQKALRLHLQYLGPLVLPFTEVVSACLHA